MFKGFNTNIARPSADPKVQMLKLTRKALGMMAGSPAQKAVIKKLNVYRKELGMEPLTEAPKYMSQASKKDRYKASKDYLMLKTKQSTLPRLDKTRYQPRKGLEGPFMTKSGQVVYYDKKFGQYYNSDTDMYIDHDDWKKMSEEAPANATGTPVAGTGDDSSTVVVKKKKKLQDKLMRRLKIKEAIDRAIPDLEYPKDEITERKQQLIDMAKKHGENI